MELTVTIDYCGTPAGYKIVQEAEGLYLATLVQYDGALANTPPAHIVLIRGIRRWTGSFDRADILETLGRAIDAHPAPKAATPENSVFPSES